MIYGSIVALVTPMTNKGDIDWIALNQLVDFHLKNGTSAIVAVGTTGESATLSVKEHIAVIEQVVKRVDGKIPVIAGTGANSTSEAIELTKNAKLAGANLSLSVVPYYNKPTQEGIYQHFKKISENSSIPILLYNVPSRTASNILPETVLRLAHDCKNIIGIKEAAGDLVQAMKIIQNKPKDFLAISGDDMIALPMILSGGNGVISVIGGSFPKEFSAMVRLGLQGKVNEAYQIHYKLANAIELIFEQGNPAGIKEVFRYLGLSTNIIRLPLVNVNKDLSERIKTFISNF